LLDALRGGTDLTVASQILPRRKGILCLRRDHTTKIIGESGLNYRRSRRRRERATTSICARSR
jgi:hypothetical protein